MSRLDSESAVNGCVDKFGGKLVVEWGKQKQSTGNEKHLITLQADDES